jgi:glycosyltransferase involved in cell wall biosynthesis
MTRGEYVAQKDVDSPKSILLVLYYYHPYVSGVSVCAKRVAEGLADRGHKVTILTSRHEKNLPAEETINGVQIIRRPVLFKLNKGVIIPTFWWDIIRYSQKHDYVNPHLPLAESGFSSLFIPRHKIITTYQCDINLGSGSINKLITTSSNLLMHLQLMRSRVVIPSTEDYLLHSKMRRYAYKAKPIYPTVTPESFTYTDPSPLFRNLSVEATTKIIGFVGRVVYEKGINYLLESIPYISESLDDFKIIIVGDYTKVAGGSIKNQLDQYIEKYPGKISFTGYLDDEELKQFYSGVDVLVLPSIDPLEAFGMVQIEAMLCGAPVVASDLPGVREIVRRSGYGLISKQRDPRNIAEQITTILANPQQFKPERKRVIDIFDPEGTITSYEECMP